jgi:Flp pilus assembly protein TadG
MSRIEHATPTRPGPGGRRGRRGQSLVEFAVILPVFLLILAGIIDFGLGLYSQMTVINAAREGARLGAVIAGKDPAMETDINKRVQAMSAGLDKSKLTVDISCQRPMGSSFAACSFSALQSDDAVMVKVDYDYGMLFPLAFGNSIALSSSVQMRIEE